MGGLGGIIVGRKNMRLIRRAAEKVTAMRHANGRDVWVITHRAPDPSPTDEFIAYLVTNRGLSPVPVTTNIGSVYEISSNLRGYMKVSTDGSKIAVAIEDLLRVESYVDLFDFNNSTGRLSNSNTLVFSDYACYGVEFSPNSNLLYVASRFDPNIYQFDLTVPDIAASRVDIATPGYTDALGALQIGPDQRIYIAKNNIGGTRGSRYLDIIENPNIRGSGCDFRSNAILIGGRSRAGLPNFIQTYFRFTRIFENICEGESYFFKGADRNISGVYRDTLVSSSGVRDSRDSIIVLTLNVNPIYNEVLNEAICTGESYMVGTSSYTTPGTYINRLTTVDGCDSIVTLNLTVNPTYNEVLNEAICMGENFLFEGNIYTDSGTYTNRLTTIEGCDSIITLNLTVNPTYNEVLNEVICNGDSYMVGTNAYTAAGTYILIA